MPFTVTNSSSSTQQQIGPPFQLQTNRLFERQFHERFLGNPQQIQFVPGTEADLVDAFDGAGTRFSGHW
jgi:hypothetical protein